MNEITKTQSLAPEIMAKLVLKGDLTGLNEIQKVEYYAAFCGRLGLDPVTQPFKILRLNGKEILYPDRGCAAQLSSLHKVSHEILSREKVDDCYIVRVRASTPDGRHTENTGAVTVAGLKGEALCNAIMKAETKGKRRATLDLMGLGIVDESEIDYIPKAQKAIVYDESGKATETRVVDTTPAAPKAEEPKQLDGEAMKLSKALLDFAAAAEKTPEDILTFCRSNGLIDEKVKNLLEIPLGILQKLNGHEWAQKLSDAWKPAETPPPDTTRQESPDENEFVQKGTVQEVDSKTGTKKNGQSWTRWGVGLNVGSENLMWFGTFDSKLGEAAGALKGKTVQVRFEQNARGKPDLLAIEEIK